MSRDPVRLRESVSEAPPSLRALLHTANDDVPTPARLQAIAAAIEARATAQPVSAQPDITVLRPRSWRRPVMAFAGVVALAAGATLWLHHTPSTEHVVAVSAVAQSSLPQWNPAPRTDAVPTMRITPTEIIVEGTAVVALANNDLVSATTSPGDSAEAIIAPLTAALNRLHAETRAGVPSDELHIVVDPTTSYHLLTRALLSAKQHEAGYHRFTIGVNNTALAVPLQLPDKRPGVDQSIAGELGLFLSVAPEHTALWSSSGMEGTLQVPKAMWNVTPARFELGAVQTALLDIARRRFAGHARSDDSNRITFQGYDDLPMSITLPILAAMRCPPGVNDCAPAPSGVAYDPDHMALFPDIVLSLGFEGTIAREQQPTSVVTVRSPRPGVSIFVDGEKRGENLIEVTAPVGSHAEISCSDTSAAYDNSSGEGAISWTAEDQLVSCTSSPHASDRPAPADSVRVETDHELSPDQALATINDRYMVELSACYRATLRIDPGAKGTLHLSFTVSEQGKVVAPAAEGFPSMLSICATSRMKNWKFRASVDAHGKPIRTSFSLGLSLVPGDDSSNSPSLPTKKSTAIEIARSKKHYELGQRLVRAEKFAAAADEFKAACELNPSSTAALRNAAFAYQMAGILDHDSKEWQQSLDYYQRYLIAAPKAADFAQVEATIADLKKAVREAAVP